MIGSVSKKEQGNSSVLLIDNYDSFVYNLARYVEELGFEAQVIRNDRLSLQEARGLSPSHLIISPGPCSPREAGISNTLIKAFASKIPILGVCLGHQCIGTVFGGVIERAKIPMHGKASLVRHTSQGIFKGLPSPLRIARYHSLIVSSSDFPDSLESTAHSEEGEVMALQHRHYPVFGVQFHPEAVLAEEGHALLRNFLS